MTWVPHRMSEEEKSCSNVPLCVTPPKNLATKARWQLVLTQCAVEKGKFIRGLLDPQPPCRTGGVLRAGKWSTRSCGNCSLFPLLKASLAQPWKHQSATLFPKETQNPQTFHSFEQPKTEKLHQFNPKLARSYSHPTAITQTALSKHSILIICTEEE